jgi:hypothetical protein
VGEPKSHHRGNWRHPDLRVIPNERVWARYAFRQQWRNIPATVVVGAGEECRSVRAAACCIAPDLEETTVGGKSRKICVTSAAGLASLACVTWKGLCRPCESDQQKPSKGTHRHCGGGEPKTPRGVIRPTAVAPHFARPHFARPTCTAPTQRPRGVLLG